ncbi:MAG TPA: oxaloacetate decarboxylase [Ramlibacter sp.]|nr:oxaloacetate decarboxylase [Ramlibacter sp.]
MALSTTNATLNRRFREALTPGAGNLMPGAGNALAARVIEATGHTMLMVSGAAVANTYLGKPDIGLVSLAELAGHTAAIRDAVNIPILVDADTGFGNPVSVVHTIRTLERSGANAVMLEDQTFPKRCGHFEGKDVISKAEMVQKIKAAVDAREDDKLMILARTDSRAVEGLEAAFDRARAYQEAGADFLFIEAPLGVEELAAIPREVPGIHLCNLVIGGKTPVLPREELAKMGYSVIVYANLALQASLMAMQKALQHLHDHGSSNGIEDQLMMFKERQQMVDAAHYNTLSSKYGAAQTS